MKQSMYSLCNKCQWFTCGDNNQYGKLFDRVNEGASIEELATIIWVCSSKCSQQEILDKLKDEWDGRQF